jgi:hypothetical protein
MPFPSLTPWKLERGDTIFFFKNARAYFFRVFFPLRVSLFIDAPVPLIFLCYEAALHSYRPRGSDSRLSSAGEISGYKCPFLV